MTTKQQQKEQTHKRILSAAGKLFRKAGYKPTRIDHVMESIGLTVGGFYNHFDSKDALLRELVENTVSFSVEADDPKSKQAAHSVDEMLDIYLSKEHRDNPGSGCILPCLSSEIARADDDVRDAYTDFVNRIVHKIAAGVDSGDGLTRRQRAMAIVAMSVGGLLLSRAVNDESTSGQILNASRKAARQM